MAMRALSLATVGLGLLIACDDHDTSAAAVDASTPIVEASAPSASAHTGSPYDASMPPRPVPTSIPTVTQGMSEQIQMQTIQYMMAMETPHGDDANADPTYAAQLATQLQPIVLAFDKGGPADKAKSDRVDVIASGRKIDLRMARGCEDKVPSRVLARAGASMEMLVSHGVLLVRCIDDHTQCLQSTRDSNDILCTTVPRRAR